MFTGYGLRERPLMGVGEIDHVDVVADTGAIRSGPILPEDPDLVSATEGDLQYQRYEVALDGVTLTVSAVGAGDVEIPQAHGRDAMRDGIGADGMVDRKLRRPIGVRRSGGGLLGDRHRGGFAVGGRGRGEDQSRSPVLAHRL